MATLYSTDSEKLKGSKSARMLALIKRDIELKKVVLDRRLRNEEILAVRYQDTRVTSAAANGGMSDEFYRQNALNLPYRYARYIESQLVSRSMVIRVDRDAGEGQIAGGPADSETGKWQAISLKRAAYIAGFKREVPAVSAEVIGRGTSALAIGYHKEVISAAAAREVGKDAQSVVVDVLGAGDLEAKPGQAHEEIAVGLEAQASDPTVQRVVGMEGVDALLARKASHDEAAYKQETKQIPEASSRPTRHRIWMRKLRVGEDCGWAPYVFDTEDTPIWWNRRLFTVAEVKASPDLFSAKFRKNVKGMDARNISGVASGGEVPSSQSQSSDGRIAQGEDLLDDDEKMVEVFILWCRYPQMRSGGLRKMVCAECPDEFIEADDANPYVDTETGEGLIPGFFPIYDFTPIMHTLPIPERTLGIAPVSVGMTQFDKIAEYNRLRHESALRHSLRLYELHPSLKGNKKLQDALKNGEDGFAYFAESSQMDTNGKVVPGVTPIQFTGNTMEIDRQAAREEGDWIKMMAMPPAVLQGVGTAETATQDQQGIAAGERESGALVSYFQDRFADVLAGIRGLMRGCYDDEDFIAMLGEEGAAVMKAWQQGTTDEGDKIHVTFGANEQAQAAVERKQLMEALTLEKSEVEPVTGLPLYDSSESFEELHRSLGLGPPRLNEGTLKQLQQLAMLGMQALKAQQQQQQNPGSGNGSPKPNGSASRPPRGGPNPTEGEAPQQGTLNAGVRRDTVSVNAGS